MCTRVQDTCTERRGLGEVPGMCPIELFCIPYCIFISRVLNITNYLPSSHIPYMSSETSAVTEVSLLLLSQITTCDTFHTVPVCVYPCERTGTADSRSNRRARAHKQKGEGDEGTRDCAFRAFSVSDENPGSPHGNVLPD